MISTLANFPLH